jgi:hypothetical protein
MICLFLNGEPSLLLRDVRRDSDDNLRCGFVVNGGWDFEIRKDEALAKSGNFIVNRWPLPEYVEMEIPSTVKGDYNKVMNWARENFK